MYPNPIPVHFVYLGPDGQEEWDSEFTAECYVVPRVGEVVEADAGGGKIVHRVYHKVVTAEAGDSSTTLLATTVVLKDR